MKSMTGIGRSRGHLGPVSFRIEIKSVNHRYCEVSTRLPMRWSMFDLQIQALIRSRLSRGKIDVMVFEERSSSSIEADLTAYKSCYDSLVKIRDELGIKEDVRLEHVLSGVGAWLNRDVDAEAMWKEVEPVLVQALQDLESFRAEEGAHLKKILSEILDKVETVYLGIEAQMQTLREDITAKLSERLQSRLKELPDVDSGRLATEVIYYVDRMDITEELHRLKSHFAQMRTFLNQKDPVGRKLDFLLQEFNREFNTIASKSQNTAIAHDVVLAKADLERLREQVQNIE